MMLRLKSLFYWSVMLILILRASSAPIPRPTVKDVDLQGTLLNAISHPKHVTQSKNGLRDEGLLDSLIKMRKTADGWHQRKSAEYLQEKDVRPLDADTDTLNSSSDLTFHPDRNGTNNNRFKVNVESIVEKRT